MVAKIAKNAGGPPSGIGDAIVMVVKQWLANTNVMEPAIIDSYDPDTNTVTVKVATKQKVKYQNPTGGMAEEYIDSPEIANVPVCFPQGGGMSMTFPIQQGDECILHFANRPFWGWFQKGTVQNRSNNRMHHIRDCVAFVGINSKPNTIQNIATTGCEIRNADASIKINVSDDGIEVVGDINHNGNLTVDGNITCTGDISCDNKITAADVEASGDVVGGGISLKTHTHTVPYVGAGQGSSPQTTDSLPPS